MTRLTTLFQPFTVLKSTVYHHAHTFSTCTEIAEVPRLLSQNDFYVKLKDILFFTHLLSKNHFFQAYIPLKRNPPRTAGGGDFFLEGCTPGEGGFSIVFVRARQNHHSERTKLSMFYQFFKKYCKIGTPGSVFPI